MKDLACLLVLAALLPGCTLRPGTNVPPVVPAVLAADACGALLTGPPLSARTPGAKPLCTG